MKDGDDGCGGVDDRDGVGVVVADADVVTRMHAANTAVRTSCRR